MEYSATGRPSRLVMEDLLTPISSPKRKRDYDSDSDYDNPRASPMRFRTQLPSRPRVDALSSPTSPQSKVSRQLHDLKLNKPDLTFSAPVTAFGQGQSSLDSSGSWNTSSPPTDPEADSMVSIESPATTNQVTHKQNEVPSTPTISPTMSTERMPISPIPLSMALPTTPDLTSSKSVRMRSPPLDTSLRNSQETPPPYADLVWSASEITGHNPNDPADDGYGINGVGFRPTPAMAYARSQRRKQQVAEWKTREAKDARQKRMDRRRKISAELQDQGGVDDAEARRVRFVDA